MSDAVEVERDLEVLLKEEDRFEPSEEFVKQANFSDPSIYDEAEKDFEAWWERWAKELDWFEPWQTVLEWNPPWAKWFQEGKLNASHNCLDRHVDAGKGDKVAYHWVGEDGDTRDVTYAEMLDMTKRFANALKGLGVQKGDVVGIYMPMLPETPAAMLACSRIGATHNVVFGGFSVEAVRERMDVSEAKVLVTADATLRRGKPTPMKANVDEVLDQLPKLEHVVVVNRTDGDCPMKDGRDVWWHEELEKADAECEPELLDAEHPLYILYTSGSTAKPKGILHT
ncbi:MAG TPA: AMP-binding protein, partial [Thermoleophilaceae bacterium]|nr:AMP-binding protein [Thermoleophilaceae bacterium]